MINDCYFLMNRYSSKKNKLNGTDWTVFFLICQKTDGEQEYRNKSREFGTNYISNLSSIPVRTVIRSKQKLCDLGYIIKTGYGSNHCVMYEPMFRYNENVSVSKNEYGYRCESMTSSEYKLVSCKENGVAIMIERS